MTEVILINKLGQVTNTKIKTIKEDEFYKKCGFKNDLHFGLCHTWNLNINKQHLNISLYAKKESRLSNIENKYEFPPPVDNQLYFGTCLLVLYTVHNGTKKYIHLTVDIWNTIYEKLYGGFEDLSKTALSDELEPDELAHVPKHKLTKEGYLKDGFVVDNKVIKNKIPHQCDDELDDDDDGDYVGSDDNISEVGSDWSDLPDEDKKPKKNKNVKKHTSSSKQSNISTPIHSEPILVEELTSEPYI
jgi:hypothetical protein